MDDIILTISGCVPFIGMVFSLLSFAPLFYKTPEQNKLRWIVGILYSFISLGYIMKGYVQDNSCDYIWGGFFVVIAIAWFVMAYLIRKLANSIKQFEKEREEFERMMITRLLENARAHMNWRNGST